MVAPSRPQAAGDEPQADQIIVMHDVPWSHYSRGSPVVA